MMVEPVSNPDELGRAQTTSDPVQRMALEHERMRVALHKLTFPVPGTKGLPPKDRAARLHAEAERRIIVAKEALVHG